MLKLDNNGTAEYKSCGGLDNLQRKHKPTGLSGQ